MRKFYLLLLLPILATLLISCTSNPKPRIVSWGHDDEWDTRRSIIRAQLAVPDGNTIGEIQIRFSRLPRGSELISGPDELLSNGDPGIQTIFRESSSLGSNFALVTLGSRAWGIGDQLGKRFFQNGDRITFSLVINYTNSEGESLTTTDGPRAYNFGHLADDIFRPSTRRDGNSFNPASVAVAITDVQGNTVQTIDTRANLFHEGDEVLLISMQGDRAGEYHLGIVGNIAFETNNGIARTDFTLCESELQDLDILSPVNTNSDGRIDGESLSTDSECEPMGNTFAGFSGDTKIQMVKIFHFDTVSVRNGVTLSASAWNGTTGGVMFFRAQHVLVEPTGMLEMSGRGFRGSGGTANGLSGLSGESHLGPVQENQRGGAGSGAQSPCEEFDCEDRIDPDDRPTIGPGGGGASYGNYGADGVSNEPDFLLFTPGESGRLYGRADLSQLFLGAGGGAGGGGRGGPGTQDFAGTGGGIIVVTAGTMKILGSIQSNGVGGSTNSNVGVMGNCARGPGSGEGGGGAGGTIWLSATSLIVRDASTLTGDILTSPNIMAEGRRNECPLGGGIGGLGRIRLDYMSIQGVTADGTPTNNSAFSEGTEEASVLTKRRTDPDPLVVGGF